MLLAAFAPAFVTKQIRMKLGVLFQLCTSNNVPFSDDDFSVIFSAFRKDTAEVFSSLRCESCDPQQSAVMLFGFEVN